MVFNVCLGLLGLYKFLLEFILPFHPLFFHLLFKVILIFLIKIFSKLFFLLFLPFECCKFVLPSFFKFLIIVYLLLLLSFASLNLIFQRLLILLFQKLLFFILFPFNFCLFFLKFLYLGRKSLNLIILYLTHFKTLLFVEFFSLLNLLIDKILLPFFCQVLNNFWIINSLPCFLRYY